MSRSLPFRVFFFFLMIRRPPRSTLFPYTTSSDLKGRCYLVAPVRSVGVVLASVVAGCAVARAGQDRKSTRLNSSHDQISYAVFCLKKKNNLLMTHRYAENTYDIQSLPYPVCRSCL